MNVQSSFPILSTDRLVLRQLKETDDEAIFSLRSDENVNRFLDRPRQTKISEAAAFIKKINANQERNESYYWAISLKEDPSLLGTICIWNISADRKKGELGYELLPAHQGKGIMNEAIARVIDFAFKEAGLINLEAYTHKDNISSTKLLLKNQFSHDPLRKDPDNPDIIIFLLSLRN